MDEFLCKYSKTVVHNFFCSEVKKRIIRSNLRIKAHDLIEQYGEENYLTSLQQKIECSKICTVEEEIVYNPIPNEVEDKLSPTNKELLGFILKQKSISAKSYADAFNLKLDTADKRIRRFRNEIKKEMLQWLSENPEEAKLMPQLFYYCNSH